ncbi:MAG: hypothetical protein IJ658_04725 [Kiritimatiellae bacterium]|nr:hypothetical protein [Kiritimatiellia bacterium]
MPLSLDSIRNFAGTGQILYSQKDGLQSAGASQRLKSFFDIGDARQKNAETLTSIHQAIVNDPRFFARSVQQKAVELLSQVRADRAISATQIKSIVDQLDNMAAKISTPADRNAAAREILEGRYASRGLPAFLSPVGKTNYLYLAGETIVPCPEPACGYARFDYDSGIDAFEDMMRALFDRLGDGPGDKEVLSACIKSFRDGGGGGVKTQDKLERLVDQFKANLDESRALGAQYGEQTRLDVVEMLMLYGRPIKTDAATPTPIRTFVEAGRALPLGELRSLNANSSPTAINDALVNFLLARDRAVVANAPQGDMDDAQVALSLMAKSALNSLSDAEKASLLDALESEAGKNILAFAHANGMGNAYKLGSLIDSMAIHLKTLLGRPDPEEPIAVPEEPDVTKLSARVLSQFSIDNILSGDAVGPYKKLAAHIAEACRREPLWFFQQQMREVATSQTIVNICHQMSEICKPAVNADGQPVVDEDGTERRVLDPHKDMAFDRDLPRGGAKVDLPGGVSTRPDMSRDAARSKIVQFITDDPDATFDAADPVVQKKALIVMATMNQSTGGVAMNAFKEAITWDQDLPAAALLPTTSSARTDLRDASRIRQRIETYALSKDANGDITMKYRLRRYMSVAMNEETGHPQPLKPDSYEEYEMEIIFPSQNLDDLARIDWGKYNHEPIALAEKGNAPTSEVVKLVDDAYKFTGTVAISSHIHMDWDYSVQLEDVQ